MYSPNQNEHNRPGKIKSDLAELERLGLVTYDIQLVERKVGDGTWWDGGAPGRGNGWSISRPGYVFGYEIKETYRHIGNLTTLGSHYITVENGRLRGKTGNIQFDMVNGIAEEPDGITAQVQYTEKFTDITPVGEYLGKQEERFPKNCIFKRYDDGWRMEQEQ